MRNKISKTYKLALVVASLIHFMAFATDIQHNKDVSFQLGQGYDSKIQPSFGNGNCLEDVESDQGYSEGSPHLLTEISQEDLARELGVAAGGRYRTGVTTVSAAASFVQNSESSGFSISYIYTADYTFAPHRLKEFKWTNYARGFLRPAPLKGSVPVTDKELLWQGPVQPINPKLFRAKCGNQVVVSQQMGAKFFFSIRVDFASKKDLTAFNAEASLSSPTLDLNAKVATKLQSVSKRTKVTVSALQIGGDVSRVTEIFGQNLSPEKDKAMSFVHCSAGDFPECYNILASAVAYATDTKNGFPAQLKLDPKTPGQGPAILSSKTQDYESITGLIEAYSPERDALIEGIKVDLHNRFETLLHNWLNARRMKESGIPRLTYDQEQGRSKTEARVFTDLERVTQAIDTCYFSPVECENANKDLAFDQPNGVKSDYTKDLAFAPQSFAALCDKQQAGENEKVLAKTVQALLEIAGKCKTFATATSPNGETICPLKDAKDYCAAAESELSDLDTLNLSDLMIKDLSPLQFLPQISTLVLTSDGLTSADLKPLASLTNLQTLDLSNNLIKDTTPLATMTGLVNVNLSGNKIRDAKPLAGLNLNRLNLANNSARMTCPFEDRPEVCLLVDYSRYTQFVEASFRLATPRPSGHLVDVDGDWFAVLGGAGTTPIELVNRHTQAHVVTSKNLDDALYSSFVNVGKGEILAFGGGNAHGRPFLLTIDTNSMDAKATNLSYGGPRVSSAQSVVLSNGDVLVTGGYDEGYPLIKSVIPYAFIYHTATHALESLGSMNLPRVDHRMVALPNGQALIIGGMTYSETKGYIPTNSIESYDPVTKSFHLLSTKLNEARYGHAALKIDDSHVFIAGGFNTASQPKAETPVTSGPAPSPSPSKQDVSTVSRTAEILDLQSLAIQTVDMPMVDGRAYHETVLLETGDVLLVGGVTNNYDFDSAHADCTGCLASAEIFSVKQSTFVDVGHKMSYGRVYFSAFPLDGRRVYINGGIGAAAMNGEIFEYNGL